MIRLAAITALANYIIVALAFAYKRIAFKGTQLIAVAALTVLQLHCITIEARRAQIASHARCVVQATQTFARACVAGARLVGIYIAGAFARLAHIPLCFR